MEIKPTGTAKKRIKPPQTGIGGRIQRVRNQKERRWDAPKDQKQWGEEQGEPERTLSGQTALFTPLSGGKLNARGEEKCANETFF